VTDSEIAAPSPPEPRTGLLPVLLASARIALAAAALIVTGWFVWGQRYWILYAYAPRSQPAPLGDVTNMRPEDIPHNAFVSISGITEHRGLTQKATRGLSLSRREYWMFRLVGSRGVFIAVEADPERYGVATELTVEGRAVDPQRDACCDAMLKTYRDNYDPADRGSSRVILVDERPGEKRGRYALLLLAFVGLAIMNVIVVARTAKRVFARSRHA